MEVVRTGRKIERAGREVALAGVACVFGDADPHE